MNKEDHSKLGIFIGWSVLLICVVAGFGYFMRGLWADPASRGLFFESFNILNTVFSGLAFAGVIFAILLQRRELHLQREELESTREELRRAAEAQEHSQEALKQQVIALNETVRISQASLQPQVIVYAEADESRPSIILLVIENVGRGATRNVRFRYSNNLPNRAFGIEKPASGERSPVMDSGPLKTGIPFLPPGGKRRLTWGQYGGLQAAIGDSHMPVFAQFENLSGETQPEIESLIDIKSFEYTDAVDPDGARQSARHLEKIARDIGHVVSGFQKPVVLVASKASHDRRERERVDEIRKRAAERKDREAKEKESSAAMEAQPPPPPAEVSQINKEWKERT